MERWGYGEYGGLGTGYRSHAPGWQQWLFFHFCQVLPISICFVNCYPILGTELEKTSCPEIVSRCAGDSGSGYYHGWLVAAAQYPILETLNTQQLWAGAGYRVRTRHQGGSCCSVSGCCQQQKLDTRSYPSVTSQHTLKR